MQTKILDEVIFYMKKVKDVFVSTVAKVENVDTSSYKTSRLKQTMKKWFPQLVFHVSKRKNKSEIVYSNCLKKSDVVNIGVCASVASTKRDCYFTTRYESK